MTPYFEDAHTTLYCGDALTVLPQLPAQRVQCVVTSPPYFGLRAYGTAPQVWDDPGDCAHLWGAEIPQDSRHVWTPENSGEKQTAATAYPTTRGMFCQHCQAWCGDLGLEPTIDLYVSHLVQIFREVRRVLRDDGVMWLVIGDSYSGYHGNSRVPDAEAPSNKPGYIENMRRSTVGVEGLKPKDLMMIPARVALALQADGWTLRNEIPWVKWNGMPESVQDRATVSHETVFLFSKGPRYFWDMEVIRRPHQGITRPNFDGSRGTFPKSAVPGQQNLKPDRAGNHLNGRNRRTGDWYTESLDEAIAATEAWVAHAKQVRAKGGMLLDPDGEPMGLLVNTRPYPEAHFATFPPKLITPMIQASTSERGCCRACGAPWVRVVERTDIEDPRAKGSSFDKGKTGINGQGRVQPGIRYLKQVIGWQPSCTCDAGAPGPCTVLDPFAGSGTTLSVARTLGRWAIGIELNPHDCDLTVEELAQGVFAFET